MSRYPDITGLRSGKLEAIRCVGRTAWKDQLWECRCDCGKTCIKRRGNLVRSRTHSCGCSRHVGSPRAKTEIKGRRFGLLIAIELSRHTRRKEAVWTCKCDCGSTKDVRRPLLLNGNVKSCGCLKFKKRTCRMCRKAKFLTAFPSNGKGRRRLDCNQCLRKPGATSTPAERARCVALYKHQNIGVRRLAVMFGRTDSTISQWLKDANVPRRPYQNTQKSPANGALAEVDRAIMRARLEAGMIDGKRRIRANPWPTQSSLA